jgi:hypothetical protein
MPYKDPMPTVGGKVSTALYARVQRVLKRRELSMQKWIQGNLPAWLEAEETALGLKRKRKGTPRRPLRELPPLETTTPGPSGPGAPGSNL